MTTFTYKHGLKVFSIPSCFLKVFKNGPEGLNFLSYSPEQLNSFLSLVILNVTACFGGRECKNPVYFQVVRVYDINKTSKHIFVKVVVTSFGPAERPFNVMGTPRGSHVGSPNC